MTERSSFRRLLESSDKLSRGELEDYYIIHKCRMDNMLNCLEDQAKKMIQLNCLIIASKTLLAVINEDKDGDYFICKECSDVIDKLEDLIK